MGKGFMVYVLPLPVCPYAKHVAFALRNMVSSRGCTVVAYTCNLAGGRTQSRPLPDFDRQRCRQTASGTGENGKIIKKNLDNNNHISNANANAIIGNINDNHDHVIAIATRTIMMLSTIE